MPRRKRPIKSKPDAPTESKLSLEEDLLLLLWEDPLTLAEVLRQCPSLESARQILSAFTRLGAAQILLRDVEGEGPVPEWQVSFVLQNDDNWNRTEPPCYIAHVSEEGYRRYYTHQR